MGSDAGRFVTMDLDGFYFLKCEMKLSAEIWAKKGFLEI